MFRQSVCGLRLEDIGYIRCLSENMLHLIDLKRFLNRLGNAHKRKAL
jgi:hypothetical protein